MAAAVEDPGASVAAEVLEALTDDLNTPLAVAAMSAPLKAMNDLLHTKKAGRGPGQERQVVQACTSERRRSSRGPLNLQPRPVPRSCC